MGNNLMFSAGNVYFCFFGYIELKDFQKVEFHECSYIVSFHL